MIATWRAATRGPSGVPGRIGGRDRIEGSAATAGRETIGAPARIAGQATTGARTTRANQSARVAHNSCASAYLVLLCIELRPVRRADSYRQGSGRRFGDAARSRNPGGGGELRLRNPEAGARALRRRARMDRRDALPAVASPPPARLRNDGVAKIAGRTSPQVLRAHRRGTSSARRPAATVARRGACPE
jgi:hypothetical protein